MTANGLGPMVGRSAIDPHRRRIDTTTLLCIYVVLLFGIPADLRLPALGGAGAPSTIWALGGGLWWAWTRLARSEPSSDSRISPVKAAALLFLAAALASYVTAMTRPLAIIEGSQADIGMLRVAAIVSVVLMAADGISSIARLQTLITVVIWTGAGLAAIGLAQFATGREIVDAITIPGFVSTQDFTSIGARGGYVRPAGTAMSPLEYATALSFVLPIALTAALYSSRPGIAKWFPAGIVGLSLMLSGSRSAFLGLAIGILALFPSWSGKIRTRVAAAGFAALIAMAVAVPGMIGTLRYLFTETGEDPSAQSRSGSLTLVMEFVSRNPIFGRGFGTFLPQYRILDNQYLLLAVEVGVVGLAAFISIWLSGAICAFRAKRLHTDDLTRQLGQALGAGALVVGLLPLFFDALSFPMAAGCFALACGMCASYWRNSDPALLPKSSP